MASPEIMKQAVNNPNAPIMPGMNGNPSSNSTSQLQASPEAIKGA